MPPDQSNGKPLPENVMARLRLLELHLWGRDLDGLSIKEIERLPAEGIPMPDQESERQVAWVRYEAAARAAYGKPTLSLEADECRAALRELNRLRCVAGYHEDPDNSGMCIRCSAVLDEDEDK